MCVCARVYGAGTSDVSLLAAAQRVLACSLSKQVCGSNLLLVHLHKPLVVPFVLMPCSLTAPCCSLCLPACLPMPRETRNVLLLSNTTLWVPAAEFSFIRSHTAAQLTSFTINLQGETTGRHQGGGGTDRHLHSGTCTRRALVCVCSVCDLHSLFWHDSVCTEVLLQ